jgi:hypothetical protein
MTYVRLDQKAAELSSDFGLDWATKLFGAEALVDLPKYTRGPKAGKPKGYVIWRKAATSGYCRETSTPCKVGQLVDAWIGSGYYSSRSDCLSGQWLGRVQPLGCSASTGWLFAEGRARHAAEQARFKAEDDARWAEFKKEMAQ